jgi:hypothetical protein
MSNVDALAVLHAAEEVRLRRAEQSKALLIRADRAKVRLDQEMDAIERILLARQAAGKSILMTEAADVEEHVLRGKP